MQFVGTLLGGLAVIVFESVMLRVLGVGTLVPQLGVVLMVFVGLRRGFDQGAALTLILAAVADLCSGGPRGYYALGMTCVFLLTASLGATWKSRGVLAVALWTAGGVLLTDLVCLAGAAVFRGDLTGLSFLAMSPLNALWTALIALPFVSLGDALDRLGARRDRARPDFG